MERQKHRVLRVLTVIPFMKYPIKIQPLDSAESASTLYASPVGRLNGVHRSRKKLNGMRKGC